MNRILAIAGICLLVSPTPAAAQQAPLTHKALQAELLFRPSGAAAQDLGKRVRAWLEGRDLRKGVYREVGLNAAWAIELPETVGNVAVVSSDGKFSLPMRRLDDAGLYAAALELPDTTGMKWSILAEGKGVASGNLEVYNVQPEMFPDPNVPHGTVTQMPPWKSRIFAGTTRDWWVYVPAQYTPEKPACVMVFQDGGGPKGYAPPVFDNLIAKGQMPVTVGIFINPGSFEGGRSNRSFEYDTLSDQYARFLLEEILPEVEKKIKLRHDAPSRAVAGISSGAICAFTVAYERPNEFSKVLSWVGSFTNIQHGKTFKEGGHNYAGMVRKGPVKPIRVFLQDGENDLDDPNGNWPLANLTLANSLQYRGWDYKLVFGHGFHSDRHGRAIMPDSLRWLWRDHKAE